LALTGILFLGSCQEIEESPDQLNHRDDLIAKVFPPELDPTGRISFANLNSFSDFLENNIAKPIEELKLFEDKFVSLRQKNEELARTNPASLQILDDDIEEDSIITDEFTASIVNEKRELMIDGKVVRYTGFGTMVYHDYFTERLEKILETMTQEEIKNIYASHDFEDDPFYEIEPGIFLFGSVEEEEAHMELKVMDQSKAAWMPTAPQPQDFDFYYCNRTTNRRTFTDNYGHWTGGIRQTEYIYFASNRRMKAKVWTTNYGTHSTGGYFTRLQRRRLGVWWASDADIVSISVKAKTYHPMPATKVYYPLYYKPGPSRLTDNGTRELFNREKVNILWPPYTATVTFSPGSPLIKQCKPEYNSSPGWNPIDQSKPIPCKPSWKFSLRVKIKESESCHYVKRGNEDGEIRLKIKKNDG